MRLLNVLLLVSFLAVRCADAQLSVPSDSALAAMLADDLHNSEKISKLLPYLQTKKAMLLGWTEHPPDGVSKFNLFDGLADVFGRLRVEEAVPFLTRNIGNSDLYNWRNKATETIPQRMPYIRALIQIGTPALPFLEKTCQEPLTPGDRILILFAIAEIDDNSEVRRHFLVLARADTQRQLEFIERGLNGK